MFDLAAALLLLLAAVVQIGYINLFLQHPDRDDEYLDTSRAALASGTPNLSQYPLPKVSIVICAHNEEAALQAYLPAVLRQDYSDASGNSLFEVLVVNDRSTDCSQTVLERLAADHPALRVITIAPECPRTFPGKKDALGVAIAAATHNIILMTDADCMPATSSWIRRMMYPFSLEGIAIAAGYGGYYSRPGFLNRFIQCETIHTFVLFRGMALRGRPYMAVGRNLACRKELLEAAQAHPDWLKTASGDDDMLIQLCATKSNMAVVAHPDAHTYSEAKNSWRDYLHQKQRHSSTGKLYSARTKRLLAGYALSHALFWLSAAYWINQLSRGVYSLNRSGIVWILCNGIILARLWGFYTEMNSTALALSSKSRIRFFWPVFDLCWLLYNIILSPYILWKNKRRWK